jgi:hypothetical protein
VWKIETVPSAIVAIAWHAAEDCRATQAAGFRCGLIGLAFGQLPKRPIRIMDRRNPKDAKDFNFVNGSFAGDGFDGNRKLIAYYYTEASVR